MADPRLAIHSAEVFWTEENLGTLNQQRPLAILGLGSAADATRRRCPIPISWLIDVEAGLGGTMQAGVAVRDFSELNAIRPKPFILVCTSDLSCTFNELSRLGFKPTVDFAVSPELFHLKPVLEMRAISGRLLLASGSPENSSTNGGGGVFLVEFDECGTNVVKVRSGPIYSFLRRGDELFAVDPRGSVISFDRKFAERPVASLPKEAWCHGLGWCEETGEFWLAATQWDQLLAYDGKNFRQTRTIDLSSRRQREGNWGHHPNDLCVDRSSVFVSVFSRSGLWRRDVTDGAVLEFDARSGELAGVPFEGLWMPHNPTLVNGSLLVLDSMRGRLVRSGGRVAGEFPGFTRGLASDGRRLLVGQGLNRRYCTIAAGRGRQAIDTSVQLYDEQQGLSRSLPLSPQLTDIHAVHIIETYP